MPCHKCYCCTSAEQTSRQKPLLLHEFVIITRLHLPASHRMIALYLTKAGPYLPRLVFSTHQRGWDYISTVLAIQHKLNGLLTHSIAANLAVECLATSSSTAHTERVGLYLLHSGLLQPTCASAAHVCFCIRFSALGWVFRLAFSPPTLLLTCMHHVDSLLGSLQRLQKLCAGARLVSYLMELTLSSHTSWILATEAILVHLGQGHSQTPRQPWAVFLATALQSYLG